MSGFHEQSSTFQIIPKIPPEFKTLQISFKASMFANLLFIGLPGPTDWVCTLFHTTNSMP